MEIFNALSSRKARQLLSSRTDPTAGDKAMHPVISCHQTLKKLGITPNYIGFHQILSAVELAYHDIDALFSVTKTLYPAIAKEYGTTWKAVERNIRSAVSIAWARNPALLQALAGYPLKSKPTAAQFIAILIDPQ